MQFIAILTTVVKLSKPIKQTEVFLITNNLPFILLFILHSPPTNHCHWFLEAGLAGKVPIHCDVDQSCGGRKDKMSAVLASFRQYKLWPFPSHHHRREQVCRLLHQSVPSWSKHSYILILLTLLIGN